MTGDFSTSSDKEFIPKSSTWTVLPPAWAVPDPKAVFSLMSEFALKPGELEPIVTQKLESWYPGRKVIFTGSGKEALYWLFMALRDVRGLERVYLSGYTCPDVAYVAHRAGLSVECLDLEEDGLGIDVSQIKGVTYDNKSILLLSNLYGLPDISGSNFCLQSKQAGEINPSEREFGLTKQEELESGGGQNDQDLSSCQGQQLKSEGCELESGRCNNEPLLVIDDASQGALSLLNGERIGARANSFGIVSFGRGKALCGVGGGAILLPSSASDLLEYLERKNLGLLNFGGLIKILKLLIVAALSHPGLYRHVANLPFLELGVVKVETDFPLRNITWGELIALGARLDCQERWRKQLLENTEKWVHALGNLPLVQPFSRLKAQICPCGPVYNALGSDIVPIRYPVIFPSRQLRDKVFADLTSQGLGASLSYGRALPDFPELKDCLDSSAKPLVNCRRTAECLLTLPIHGGVKESHFTKAIQIIKRDL